MENEDKKGATNKFVLSGEDGKLLEDVLKRYEKMLLGARRYSPQVYRQREHIILDIVKLTGLPPWKWTDNDIENWHIHLAKKRFKVSTFRAYTGWVRLFLCFITQNIRIAREIENLTGKKPQIPDAVINPIPHVFEAGN